MISAIITERPLLRRWRGEDREPVFRICHDAELMRYLLPMNDRTVSDAFIDRLNAHFDVNGCALWATGSRITGHFIGAVALLIPRIASPIASASATSFLLVLTQGHDTLVVSLHEQRSDEFDAVASLGDLACPVVCATAAFDAHFARGSSSVEGEQQMGKCVPVRTTLKLREVTNEHMTMLAQNPERVICYFQDQRLRYAA